MIPLSSVSSGTSSSSSNKHFTQDVLPTHPVLSREEVTRAPSTPPKTALSESINKTWPSPALVQSFSFSSYVPLSDSESSLTDIVKDSIEDLPSAVPRSPQSPRANNFSLRGGSQRLASPLSRSASPRRRFKKKLSPAVYADNCKSENVKRPLSPFTNGGILRWMTNFKAPPSTTPSSDSQTPPLQVETQNPATRNKKAHLRTDLTACRTPEKVSVKEALKNILGRRSGRD